MDDQRSFIAANHVFVDISEPRSLFTILGGSTKTTSVLRDISFHAKQGSHVTVFGHEGSGKSTLLRALTGLLPVTKGSLQVNGTTPDATKIAAGYVSVEETEPAKDTCHEILSAFARTHHVQDASAKINQISDTIGLGNFLHSPATGLSTAQRLRLNCARAALSDSPLILLDDTADQLGPNVVRHMLDTIFVSRTVFVSTRFVATADILSLPILLLHQGTLSHKGTINEISREVSTPRIVDIWIEGLRYDLLRKIRRHTGVIEARLIPASGFSGQRLRVQLQSAHYLPSIYDLMSEAPLIKVDEIPPSLNDVVTRL